MLDIDREAGHVDRKHPVGDPAVVEADDRPVLDDGTGDAGLGDQAHREQGNTPGVTELRGNGDFKDLQ